MAPSHLCLHLRLVRGLPALTLLFAASIGHAQGTPDRTERVDPLDAQARVPAVIYLSPLAGYRPLGDDKRVSWRDANETVNRIGGWRAYARQAQQPDAPAPDAAPAPGVTPTQGGHTMHGGTR